MAQPKHKVPRGSFYPPRAAGASQSPARSIPSLSRQKLPAAATTVCSCRGTVPAAAADGAARWSPRSGTCSAAMAQNPGALGTGSDLQKRRDFCQARQPWGQETLSPLERERIAVAPWLEHDPCERGESALPAPGAAVASASAAPAAGRELGGSREGGELHAPSGALWNKCSPAVQEPVLAKARHRRNRLPGSVSLGLSTSAPPRETCAGREQRQQEPAGA